MLSNLGHFDWTSLLPLLYGTNQIQLHAAICNLSRSHEFKSKQDNFMVKRTTVPASLTSGWEIVSSNLGTLKDYY